MLLSVSTKLIGVVIFVSPQGHILLCENRVGKNQVGVYSADNGVNVRYTCLMCVLKMFDDFWKKNESEVK